MMGNVAEESKEDFTLLNLSRSSSSSHSSSEQLFNQQQRLPNKKKRIRFKRRGTGRLSQKGGSSQESSHAGRSSSASWIFGHSNVVYGLIIVLLSWSATLSWLVFSLRNQLAEANIQYGHVSSLTADLPGKLERLNETVEMALESDLKSLATRLVKIQTDLKEYEKNLSLAVSSNEGLKQTLASLGSDVQEQRGRVEKVEKTATDLAKLTEAVLARNKTTTQRK